MFTLIAAIGLANCLALLLSAVPITTFKSFMLVFRMSCIVGALAGLAVGIIAADSAISEKVFAVLAGVVVSAVTVLFIGFSRGGRISKQKRMAPAAVTFLSEHFLQIASTAGVDGVATITENLLLLSMNNFNGSELKLLQYVAAHIKDIGHQASCQFVPLSMFHGEAGIRYGMYDGLVIETYEIDLKDINSYVERLAHKYAGW